MLRALHLIYLPYEGIWLDQLEQLARPVGSTGWLDQLAGPGGLKARVICTCSIQTSPLSIEVLVISCLTSLMKSPYILYYTSVSQVNLTILRVFAQMH